MNKILKSGVLLIVPAWMACQSTSVTRVSEPCSLRVRAIDESFNNAGDVRISVEPQSSTEIRILLPWSENFIAVDLTKESQWPTAGRLSDGGDRKKSRNYPIAWGVPASAWYRSRKSLGNARYELPAGRFQLVLEYIDDGSHRCYAATQPFFIQQSTFWVSTE